MKIKNQKMLSLVLSLVLLLSSSSVVTTVYAASVSQVSSLNYSDLKTTSVGLKWKKIKNATGYYVFKYSKSNKKYTKIATVKSAKYTVKKLKSATTYCFAVKAFRKKGNKTTKGKMSKILCIATKPTKVKNLVSHKYDTKSITLSWKKIKNVSGYKVYRYDTKKKKYKCVATVKTNSAKISSLSAGKTYKFKVRAYKKADKKIFYGAYSSVLKKSTIANTDIKKMLINGYLYHKSEQSMEISEYIFYSDGSFSKYIYSSPYGNDGNLYDIEYGNYTVKNGIAKLTLDNSSGSLDIYYDKTNKYFRTRDYYEFTDWEYYSFIYEKNRLSKAERYSLYN